MSIIRNANELNHYFNQFLSKSDVYASRAMAKLSAKILAKRISMKMNQKAFASFMGVSQGMISKWESAEYNFTFQAAADICEKLGLVFCLDLEDEADYLSRQYANIVPWTISSDSEGNNYGNMMEVA